MRCALCLWFSILGCFMMFAGPADAHFKLNANIRIYHVVYEDNAVRLLIRTPLPYLVADKLGPVQGDELPLPAPYTTNAVEDGVLVHYLDVDALRAHPEGLAKFLQEGTALLVEGSALQGAIGRMRLYPVQSQPPFVPLEEAEIILEGPVYDDRFDAAYVGDTVMDVELVFPVADIPDIYSLQSRLNPGLPDQEDTANLVIDHRTTEPLVYRVRGLLNEPVTVSRSVLDAVLTFTKEGVVHILEGLDHVLFVFCLILGAATFRHLAFRITGFTVGHTVTLIFGFLGYVPNAPWFVPLVETGIAASIIYAATVAVAFRHRQETVLVTTIIGLLHGLGFSFVLQEILQADAPNLWQSLLAFNLGVEIGQIAIAAIVWPVLIFTTNLFRQKADMIRWGLAAPCFLIAFVWIGERSVQTLSAFNL